MTLPPPLHGVNVTNSRIAASQVIRDGLDLRILPISYNTAVATVGALQLRKFLIYAKLVVRLAWTLLRFRPDLCYFPIMQTGRGFYRDVPLVWLMKAAGRPLIIQMHGLGIDEAIRGRCTRRLYRRVFRNAYVIHQSESVLADLAKVRDVVRAMYTVYSAIPDRETPPPRRAPSPAREFVTVSNITPMKGQLVLVRAVKRLIDAGCTAFRVRMVGQVQDRRFFDELEDVIRAHRLERFIVFDGPKFGAACIAALQTAEVFIFPSLREAFGLVAIEAMREGLPVIASDVGSLPEIVTPEVGLRFPAGDDAALAAHMRVFIERPDLAATMGQAAFRAFRAKFTFAEFERKTRAVFDEVLRIGKF
ncbi:MAG: glycosyltransferase family 4 protein [Deltaproteobacteria bacterium]|nr:glycosyltransferase family 4 protein [Deltaproteobacteria bacterium]